MKNDVVDADNKRKSVNFQLLESYTNTVKPTVVTVAPRESNVTKLTQPFQLSHPHQMEFNTLKWK